MRAVADRRDSIRRRFEVVKTEHSQASADKAVQLVKVGRGELLMKGSLHSDEILRAVAARETGLRTGRRISHIFIMDVPDLSGRALRHRRCREHRSGSSRRRSISSRTRSICMSASVSARRASRSFGR